MINNETNSAYNSLSQKNDKSSKVIEKLINIFDLDPEPKRGYLSIKSKARLCTSQKLTFLVEHLNLFFSNNNTNETLAIRIKHGSSSQHIGRKRGGETNIVLINETGAIFAILKKQEKIASGGFKHISYAEINDDYLKTEEKNEKLESKKKFAFKYVKPGINNIKKHSKDLFNEFQMLAWAEENKISGMQTKHLFGGSFIYGYSIKSNGPCCTSFVLTQLYDGSAQGVYKGFSLTRHWGLRKVFEACIPVLKGLQILHDLDVCLGDIKTDNLLRDDEKKELYFTDLGGYFKKSDQKIKNIVNKTQLHLINIFTEGYFIQSEYTEMLHEKNLDRATETRKKINLFSFGVVLYEMIRGDYLYSKHVLDHSFEQRKQLIKKGLNDILKEKNIKKKIVNLIALMTSPQAGERPKFEIVIDIIKDIILPLL